MRIFARPLYPSGVGFQFGVSLRYPLYTPRRVPGFELLAANRHETGKIPVLRAYERELSSGLSRHMPYSAAVFGCKTILIRRGTMQALLRERGWSAHDSLVTVPLSSVIPRSKL
jgi:hypothetical protein